MKTYIRARDVAHAGIARRLPAKIPHPADPAAVHGRPCETGCGSAGIPTAARRVAALRTSVARSCGAARASVA